MSQLFSKRLVNPTEMLNKAKKGKYAIGHFNINNLEWTKSLLEAAQESKTPIILGATEGAIKYMGGFKTVVGMVNGLLEEWNITVPCALHLDHGGSVEVSKKAINSGFSSVMYDGSHLSFDENFKNTTEVVNYAKKFGVAVESEIGSIGGKEDNAIGAGELGSPEDAKKMKSLAISSLAAGIGNIHGVYPKNWKGLNFEVLESLSKASELPMVLHGGSGIPQEQVMKAIKLGINKVNVNTQCQIAFSDAVKKYYANKLDLKPKGFDVRKVLAVGEIAIKETFIELVTWMGSKGKN